LDHLIANDISCIVLDNDSRDGTTDILRSYERRGMIRYHHVPYRGYFDHVEQCRIKSEIAAVNGSDWFLHVDADEILESNRPREGLRQAITRIDSNGANAINFDEFVFVPTSESEHYEGTDYVATMKNYYFFEPWPVRLVRAWKPGSNTVDLVSTGGHSPKFDGILIADETLVLRHYIMLSMDHLIRKYRNRTYSRDEIDHRNWHGWRANVTADSIMIPSQEELCHRSEADPWDKTKPQSRHLFVKA
jgi:glycosyltransferase involved in cell wall biosynthesis